MVVKTSQERVKTLLKDTITLLCKNGLEFKDNFMVEAVIGVTLDNSDVFLISMNELVKAENLRCSEENANSPQAADTTTEKQRKHSKSQKRRWNSESVKVKEEPNADSEEDCTEDLDNPVGEDLWGGGDPPSLSPSTLDDVGAPSFNDNSTSEEPATKKHQADRNSGQNFPGEIKLEREEEDAESDEDLVFVKEETKNIKSCAQMESPTSHGQNYSQSFDMTLTPVGTNDGSMVWSQSQQHSSKQTQQQQQHPAHRVSRTSTMTSETPEQLQQQGDPQGMQSPQQIYYGMELEASAQNTTRKHYWNKNPKTQQYWDRKPKTKQNKQYRYHCSICRKGFDATNMLRGHMSWHTGIKEFKCPYCTVDFRYKHQLKKHVVEKHQMTFNDETDSQHMSHIDETQNQQVSFAVETENQNVPFIETSGGNDYTVTNSPVITIKPEMESYMY